MTDPSSFRLSPSTRTELTKRAGESRENARLVQQRLKEKGLKATDLETRKASEQILEALIPLGAFTVTIDDLTDKIKVESDSLYKNEIDMTGPESAILDDPFFMTYTGSTRTVYLIEPGVARDKDGFTQVSDIISLSKILVNTFSSLLSRFRREQPTGSRPACACPLRRGRVLRVRATRA